MAYISMPVRLNKVKDGKTQYLHIRYSDDGETFTANNGKELGAWIGTLVDFNEADSTNFSDYTWKKFTEDVDGELEDIRQTIVDVQTSIITDCNNIILQALERYVETSNYEEFKQTLQTELSVMSDQILMNFTTVTEQITEVDGSMQSKFTELYEWIRIAGGVMTFGSSDSAVTLSLENDSIVFRKNGVQFGSWDGENFYTGNIVIRLGERFQLGSFAFKPRPDESMMLVWVGL